MLFLMVAAPIPGALESSLALAYFWFISWTLGKDEPVISIVDDDASMREAINAFVNACGFTVAAFSSADEFLRSDRLHDTCCLIADVQMPGLTGLQLQNRLTATGHHIPIIFVTAFPDDTIRALALNAGAVCFLAKPFSHDDLLTGISSALRRKSGDRIRS
jgi:FixJ family two-component response regulator